MSVTELRPDARAVSIRLAALKAILDRLHAAYDEARHDALRALDPGDRKTASLPTGENIGTVSWVKGRRTVLVTSRKDFLEWVRRTAPDQIETVEKVNEVYEAALLRRVVEGGGLMVDPLTGEVVPGVAARTGDPYVSAKQSSDQVEALTDAYQAGHLTLSLNPDSTIGVLTAAMNPEETP